MNPLPNYIAQTLFEVLNISAVFSPRLLADTKLPGKVNLMCIVGKNWCTLDSIEERKPLFSPKHLGAECEFQIGGILLLIFSEFSREWPN